MPCQTQQMNDEVIIKNGEGLENELVHEHYGLVVSQALSFLGDDNKSNLEDFIQV